MTQQIVALTGISGVGKTTFLNRLSQVVDFQHVTGGSLIAAAGISVMLHLDGEKALLQRLYAVSSVPGRTWFCCWPGFG